MTNDTDRVIPLRHYGRWFSGAMAMLLLGLLIRAFARGQIDWPVVSEFFMAETLLKGLGNTLLITFF